MPKNITLTNVAGGLGDTLMLTDMVAVTQGDISVWSTSPHFDDVMSFNPSYRAKPNNLFLVDAPTLVSRYETGNGHFIQRLRRAFEYKIEYRPKAFLEIKEREANWNRVILHFDPGKHVTWQKRWIHPRARELYSENKVIIEQFIEAHPELEFCEVGSEPLGFEGAETRFCGSTKELIKFIGTAGWFLGIMSGPMHVATALGLRCVVIINFPEAHRIFLPTLIAIPQVEAEWFYPQNVHLHQERGTELVPELTLDSLEAAFDGAVYPYWSDDYLPLIEEKL